MFEPGLCADSLHLPHLFQASSARRAAVDRRQRASEFCKKREEQKKTTGRKTFSDGQVGGAGRGRQAGRHGKGEVACDFLCRFLVLTYDFPTLNEWRQRKFIIYKLENARMLAISLHASHSVRSSISQFKIPY